MHTTVARRPVPTGAGEGSRRRDPAFELPVWWAGQPLRLIERDGLRIADPLLPLDLEGEASTAAGGLDPAECMLMCMLLVNAVDDELHGLTRSRMCRGTASMGAKAIASARTLESAVATLCRFYDIIGGTCRFSLDRAGDDAVLSISADCGDRGQRALIEELLAHTVHMQLSYFFGGLLPLTRFVTSAPDHPAIGHHHPYLLCPMAAGSGSALVFPAQLLAAQSHGMPLDYPTWEACRFWLARHPATRTPIVESDPERPASGALLSVLKREDVPMASCSTELDLSLQDLRRSLAAEGTSFRQVRKTALIERARPHLVAGESVDDLAFALGYSDARSFRRALKLATGLSISDLRHDAMTASPDRTALMMKLREEVMQLG